VSSESTRVARGRFEKSNELWSWVLFLFSAVFFVISALRSGDIAGLIGAVLFLLACIVFLLPYLTRAITSGRRSAKLK
jgi:Ca2+/Na+ antiporter